MYENTRVQNVSSRIMVPKPEWKQELLNSWWKCQFSGHSPKFYQSVGPVWGLAVECFQRASNDSPAGMLETALETHGSRKRALAAGVKWAEGMRQPLVSASGYSRAWHLLTRLGPSRLGEQGSLWGQKTSRARRLSLSSLGYHLMTYPCCQVVFHLLWCLMGQSVKPILEF